MDKLKKGLNIFMEDKSTKEQDKTPPNTNCSKVTEQNNALLAASNIPEASVSHYERKIAKLR